ncbi:MAG: TM2 domain-containing protein [Deltaproteobacteria bacterium]|nr:TM2 domain-containing protein [Deltaproteobacteria bacterium]
MLDNMMLMKDLSDSEKLIFQTEFNAIRKDGTTGVLLALFLGGVGGHHFYMGNVGTGVLYLLFCWTFIPALAAFIELFLMSGRVKEYNEQKAQEIVVKIRAMRSGANTPSTGSEAA